MLKGKELPIEVRDHDLVGNCSCGGAAGFLVIKMTLSGLRESAHTPKLLNSPPESPPVKELFDQSVIP
ncbi:hypothetical protein C4565_05495 [Candidatus Parcubacteria bacterium]|nr:MAG: hypothetical protein C4565_05495 [Candidatus Parcubacteria bacterium]